MGDIKYDMPLLSKTPVQDSYLGMSQDTHGASRKLACEAIRLLEVNKNSGIEMDFTYSINPKESSIPKVPGRLPRSCCKYCRYILLLYSLTYLGMAYPVIFQGLKVSLYVYRESTASIHSK